MESLVGYLDHLRIIPFALEPKQAIKECYFMDSHLRSSFLQADIL
jgi:hypothetical protein